MSFDYVEKKVSSAEAEKLDSKLLPVMREAVTMVQMILFSELKKEFGSRMANRQEQERKWFAGALVNNLFCARNTDPAVAAFARDNRETIEGELHTIAQRLPPLLPHLTDALRMQALCDQQEGENSLPCLLLARALGILQEERAVPMPSTFMLSVRSLAAEHGLVKPMETAPPPAEFPEQ